jgi:hypothetical protein
VQPNSTLILVLQVSIFINFFLISKNFFLWPYVQEKERLSESSHAEWRRRGKGRPLLVALGGAL